MCRKIDAQTHRYTLQFAWSLQELLVYLVSSRLPIHGSPSQFSSCSVVEHRKLACLCYSVFWLLCVVHSALPRVLCLSISVAIGLPLDFLRRLPWEFVSRLRQESNLVSLLFSQHAAVKSLSHYCNGLVVCLLAAVFWSSARRCFCVRKFRSSPSFSCLALPVLRFCFPFPVHPSLSPPPPLPILSLVALPLKQTSTSTDISARRVLLCLRERIIRTVTGWKTAARWRT
jgi:hypothetical protein